MKTTIWKSLISALSLVVFIWLASGSLGIPEFGNESPAKKKEVYSEDQQTKEITYSETTSGNAFLGGEFKKEVIGKQDEQGRWHGHVSILYSTFDASGKDVIHEADAGFLYHGIRHGTFKRTIIIPENKEIFMCFNMGVLVPCPKNGPALKEAPSAFSLLQMKYPWFLYLLNMMEISDHQVMSFMDAVEAELASQQFEAEMFDSFYESAVVVVSANETHKSTADYINFTAMEESADLIRSNEFRMAVLEHFRSGENTTFNILKTIYPDYLNLLVQAGGRDDDVRLFCEEVETRMMLGGPFDTGSPFFTDSVDFHMAISLFGLMFEEKSFTEIMHLGRHIIQSAEYRLVPSVTNLLQSRLTKTSKQLSPQDIAYIVVYTMLMELEKGDLVRRAIREATFYDIPQLAVITTSEPGFVPGNGIELTGHVIEDGGVEVTERGIAWGSIYNPTTVNNTVSAGGGTGDYSVILTGLTEGLTYYARAYAINSVGTAYGNVVIFTGQADHTGTAEGEANDLVFLVFPNPATDVLHIVTDMSGPGMAVVSLMGIDGRLVQRMAAEGTGRQEIRMHVNDLPQGVYLIRVDQGHHSATRKVIIQ